MPAVLTLRAALALVSLVFAFLPAEAAACALRFAWWPWEPYHYLDGAGQMRGVDHALVEEASRRMGCAVTWEQVPRKRSLVLLQEGLVDAVAGLGVTSERREIGHFSRPLREGRNVLLVRKGEAGRFPATRLADLAGQDFRLGAIAGARHSEEVDRFLDDPRMADRVVGVPNSESALTMLARGRLDGYVDGAEVARRLVARLGLADMVEAHPLRLEGATAHVLFSRVSVDPELVARFDAALATMEADGTAARLVQAGELE